MFYFLSQYPSIGFELQEEGLDDEWEELMTPFEFMMVFDLNEVIG